MSIICEPLYTCSNLPLCYHKAMPDLASEISEATIVEVIELSRLLGEYGQIKRGTRLPGGDFEPDSHHSFNLALVAFDLASKYATNLSRERILIFCLVHDLPELITGDEPTLTATAKSLRCKERTDAAALPLILKRLHPYPALAEALEDYESGQSEEAKFVYWLDKMITIPTHFFDDGATLREHGIKERAGIADWYARALDKLERRAGQPPPAASAILRLAYQKMHDELFDL